jgi:hypothetical protein
MVTQSDSSCDILAVGAREDGRVTRPCAEESRACPKAANV